MNASVFRHRGQWVSGSGSDGQGGASVPLAVAVVLLPLAAVATATLCAALFAYVLFAVTWRVSAAAVTRVTDRRGAVADADDDEDPVQVIQHRPSSQSMVDVSLAGLATAA
jgi:hypothetical protein